MHSLFTVGDDYEAVTVSFIPNGDDVVCLPVSLLDDMLLEGEEDFPLVIDSGVVLGDRVTTTLRIIDNDSKLWCKKNIGVRIRKFCKKSDEKQKYLLNNLVSLLKQFLITLFVSLLIMKVSVTVSPSLPSLPSYRQ